MKRTICFSLFFIFYQPAFSQLPAIDSMKRSLEHTTDPEERFKTLNEILVNIDALGIPIPDSTYWLEMLQIGQKTKNDLILATSYNWIGYNFYRVKGAYTSALEYYFKALPLAERSGNKRRISSLCFDIGQVYTLLDNSEEAFKYTRKGGENLPDRSSPMYNYMLVQFQRGMSNSFLKLNRLDSALYYAQQMEQTSMLLNAKIFRFNAKSQAATVYAQMGETELADIYFRKAKSDAAFISEGSRKLFFFKSYIPFLIKNKRIREAVLETDTFYAQARETKNLLSLLMMLP